MKGRAFLAAALLVLTAVVTAGGPAPCEDEDSAGPCVWDASSRGNGVGHSFVVDSAQVIHYTDG